MNFEKIVELVYECRYIISKHTKSMNVSYKQPFDFVTIIDTEISAFLKDALHEHFPDIGFVTEEETEHLYDNKFFILDPIDGTTNLVYDYKMSSVSLAYIENGIAVFGIVFNPFSNEMFLSVIGNGAYLYKTNRGISRLLSTGVLNYRHNKLNTKKRSLEFSIIEFGANCSRKDLADETFERGCRIFKKCLDFRRTCSTALAICYVASGRIDGYYEKHIKPWDYAAGILILAEAGGTATDWNGEALPFDRNTTIVCSNGNIHGQLLNLINEK